MSIANKLTELHNDKSDIQDALVAKGVTSAGKHRLFGQAKKTRQVFIITLSK